MIIIKTLVLMKKHLNLKEKNSDYTLTEGVCM